MSEIKAVDLDILYRDIENGIDLNMINCIDGNGNGFKCI